MLEMVRSTNLTTPYMNLNKFVCRKGLFYQLFGVERLEELVTLQRLCRQSLLATRAQSFSN